MCKMRLERFYIDYYKYRSYRWLWVLMIPVNIGIMLAVAFISPYLVIPYIVLLAITEQWIRFFVRCPHCQKRLLKMIGPLPAKCPHCGYECSEGKGSSPENGHSSRAKKRTSAPE